MTDSAHRLSARADKAPARQQPAAPTRPARARILQAPGAPARRRVTAGTALAGLAFLSLATPQARAADDTQANALPRFETTTPCPFEAAQGVDPARLHCGHLVTQLDREQPDLGTVRIPVAVIRTTRPQPRPDPVVFIAGGPGAAPVTSARTFELFSAHRFNRDRDVILFTQRGGLGATPELRCDALRDQRRFVYLEDHTLAQRDQAIGEVAVACLHDLQQRGLPASAWSTQANALDLRDLRQALELPQWNLMAVSYGTLIALETARVDPGGVRSLVLDSLVSPESDLFMGEAARNYADGMERVLAACEADPACQARFPDLRGALERVLESLRAQPLTVAIDGPDGPATLDMVVNWHDFLALTHWMLYNATTLSWVPLLIDETDHGRYAVLTNLLSRVFPAPARSEDYAAGTFFAVVCRDQYHPERLPGPADDRFGGYAMSGFMESICAAPELGYGAYPPVAPVALDTPTLLLAGRFDLITPERYANQVLHGLTRGVMGRVANFGHSTLSGYTACQTDIAGAFLDDPEGETDLSCLRALDPPVFATSVEAIPD